jgi:hypothetical protein
MDFASFLQEVYDRRWTKLVELNEALIRMMFDWPDLCSKMVRASDLDVKGSGSDLPPFERNGIAVAQVSSAFRRVRSRPLSHGLFVQLWVIEMVA